MYVNNALENSLVETKLKLPLLTMACLKDATYEFCSIRCKRFSPGKTEIQIHITFMLYLKFDTSNRRDDGEGKFCYKTI